MAMVVCSIPKGYSAETKKRLIAALGDVECIGFSMSRQVEHVYIQEFDADHVDETMKRTKYVVIYTGAGKKTEAKAKVVELFKQKIDEVFGPEDTDYASVVIEEHVNELIACEGQMRCEDPVAVAAQLNFQK